MKQLLCGCKSSVKMLEKVVTCYVFSICGSARTTAVNIGGYVMYFLAVFVRNRFSIR